MARAVGSHDAIKGHFFVIKANCGLIWKEMNSSRSNRPRHAPPGNDDDEELLICIRSLGEENQPFILHYKEMGGGG